MLLCLNVSLINKHGEGLHALVSLLLPANTEGLEYDFTLIIVNRMWHSYLPSNEYTACTVILNIKENIGIF